MSDVREVNFDGLVGPTHNYSGLAHGNLASHDNAGLTSSPRQAALQGLAKMKALKDAGYLQGVIPPAPRPLLSTLSDLGFHGPGMLDEAAREAPALLRAAFSASSMWVANAATVTPSADSQDGKVHFTPANLQSSLHRSLEVSFTSAMLARVFASPRHFVHHPALPATPALSDEGAANHTRLCAAHGGPGVHLFVYGRDDGDDAGPMAPQRFQARQSLAASQAVARQHGLGDHRAVFARQHPRAIDAGVFHNDVIAVGNGPVLLYHELAFADEEPTLEALRERMLSLDGTSLLPVRVPIEAVSLEDAVSSYLFNSQLLSNGDGSMSLVVPVECQRNEAVWFALQTLLLDGPNPISELLVQDVTQSMSNGGGPACLRLRVALSGVEREALGGRLLLCDSLYADLTAWVERHYRDRLSPEDLTDPRLADETFCALEELEQILDLPGLYGKR
ncbi:N-succinylarginine dihydrolase [Halotalea alkalilenta]|uniref:N-succinylarginine dihydrolase n=1 Tax=Halotalea alkalilenta TaxID=376489 RepID=UPI00047F2D6A|nr:N-succinylarginine dihydrolase [Halotalea alkalilenta]